MQRISTSTPSTAGQGRARRSCGRVSYCLALSALAYHRQRVRLLVAAHLARRAVGVGEVVGLVTESTCVFYINTSVICAIGALSPVGRWSLDVMMDTAR